MLESTCGPHGAALRRERIGVFDFGVQMSGDSGLKGLEANTTELRVIQSLSEHCLICSGGIRVGVLLGLRS